MVAGRVEAHHRPCGKSGFNITFETNSLINRDMERITAGAPYESTSVQSMILLVQILRSDIQPSAYACSKVEASLLSSFTSFETSSKSPISPHVISMIGC